MIARPEGYHRHERLHRKAHASREAVARMVAFHPHAWAYGAPQALAATILAHTDGLVRLAADEWVAWRPAGSGFVDIYLLGPAHVAGLLAGTTGRLPIPSRRG